MNLQQLLCFLVFCRLLLVELLPWSWRGLDESSSRLREDRLQAGALVLQGESSFTRSRKEYSEQDIRSCSPNQFLTAPGRAKLKCNTELREGLRDASSGSMVQRKRTPTGPYLGFFVCGGKLGFREISDQYSYKKQPSKIRHYVRKKTFSFPGGGNCPLRPPAMYGPGQCVY